MLAPRRSWYTVVMMTTERRNRTIRSIAAIIICASVWIAVIFVDWGFITDRIHGLSFEPTTELTSLKDELSLTTRGSVILSATHPTVKDQTEFNQACASSKSDVSILGCYDGQNIFIYDINNPDLAGIKQSTLAHELLHAVWDRLSSSERAQLQADLQSVYEANLSTLQPRLDLYPEANFYDELHSIIGTELADLPNSLEKHYARYFNDQDAVVVFFDAYDTKFKELKAQAEALYEQINLNRELVDAKAANYTAATEELTAAIADFNRRAESGYFTSTAAFTAERAVLVARQQELNQLFHEINTLIDSTNELVEEYNNNIARAQVLLDSINSNASPAPEI